MSEFEIKSGALGYYVNGLGAEVKFAEFRTYELDFDKIKTLEDVIAVLRGLQMTITIQDGYGANWESLMPYLKPKP